MTKISQLTDIGGGLAANDEFIIRDVSDASTPNKKVTASGFFAIASTLGITGFDNILAGLPATGTQVRVISSGTAVGISGYAQTTISGITVARTTISGYYENASGVVGGTLFPVVTQTDIGTDPNQVPVCAMLGNMAFTNYPFWRGGSDTTTTSGTVIIDGSSYERFNYTASMATGITVQLDNMTGGRETKLYVRNTNATARPIVIVASTTTSGHTGVPLSPGNGAASVSGITLAATTGTAIVWVGNINGTIVGGLF
jgi:hypothetical protein